MTPLDQLIDAVRAGSIGAHDLDAFIPVLGLSRLTDNAFNGYRMSLGAAVAFVEELMPGCEWTVESTGYASVVAEPMKTKGHDAELAIPARSLILAGLMEWRDVQGEG